MKIGVDAREIQNGVITGIGRSLNSFIRYFEKFDTKNRLILFSEKKIPISYGGSIDEIIIKKSFKPLWDQIKLPLAINKNKIDLFYSPYCKVPLLSNVLLVNQVLDLMYLAFPPYWQTLSLTKRIYWKLLGREFTRRSRMTITDSLHAKKDIVRFWNIEEKKIEVIPLGISKNFYKVEDMELLESVKIKYNLPDRYIIYLGNFKPHKNVESLIEAFAVLDKKFIEYHLVLAGPLDSSSKRIIELVSNLKIEKRVLFTDTIRENDFPEAILTMATLFVFPSLYEGFGLPPLEAMACNLPVIASKLTSIPEVVESAALTVNPLNITELSKAIEDLLVDREKRECYREKGLLRVKMFSEEESGRKIYESLIQLMEKKR